MINHVTVLSPANRNTAHNQAPTKADRTPSPHDAQVRRGNDVRDDVLGERESIGEDTIDSGAGAGSVPTMRARKK